MTWLRSARSWLRRVALRARRRWLRPQQRVSQRHAVACEARLDIDAGTLHVMVRNVSEGGALLELDEPLEPGARAQLRFPHLPGRPATWCLVQHALRQGRRIGVEFQGDAGANSRLAAELIRLHGTPGPPAPDPASDLPPGAPPPAG
jgi:hypothetical protein